MNVTVIADALSEIGSYLDRCPEAATTAARIAINDTIAGRGRTLIKQEMLRQVEFPPNYIDTKRLYVKRKAYNHLLEAVLAARQRPTSLARFATRQTPDGARKAGSVRVTVKPGHARDMKGAFLIRLKRGAELTDDNYNLGLAIRLKPGEQIRNKNTPFNADSNLHILYGPSVDQVMNDAVDNVVPDVLKEVDTEFFRQFARITGD
jgi:hypothetical protein